MFSPIAHMCRQATRKPSEPLNILTFPTHERWETNLAKTGHTFWSLTGPGIKSWNTKYAPIPKNYHIIPFQGNSISLPAHLDIDLILSQNKFGQIQISKELGKQLGIPVVSIEHTLPMPDWNQDYILAIKQMSGDVNLFITEYNRAKWGFSAEEGDVVHHSVDELFRPTTPLKDRENSILSVVNDWINRDWCCGFKIWKQATEGLPVKPVGDTPGLSLPAENVEALAETYNKHRIFVNTSTHSPIPMALIEAMACGCAIVSLNNCAVPEFLKHNESALLVKTPLEMREALQRLLKDLKLCERLGDAASVAAKKFFSTDRFVKQWNDILYKAADIVPSIPRVKYEG